MAILVDYRCRLCPPGLSDGCLRRLRTVSPALCAVRMRLGRGLQLLSAAARVRCASREPMQPSPGPRQRRYASLTRTSRDSVTCHHLQADLAGPGAQGQPQPRARNRPAGAGGESGPAAARRRHQPYPSARFRLGCDRCTAHTSARPSQVQPGPFLLKAWRKAQTVTAAIHEPTERTS